MGDDDIVAYERNRKLHKMHRDRISKMKPCIDTTTPKSLGLKHMYHRPKKQQLIDDRRQLIAFENRRLMEHMTKILSEPQQKMRYVKPPSLNETERKLKTDLINLDNKLLVDRLKKVPPVIDVVKMKEDFKRHQELAKHMRRKIPGQDISPDHKSKSKNKSTYEGSLDGGVSQLGMSSASYYGEQGPMLTPSGLGIESISEFRRQIINKKSGGGVKKLDGLKQKGTVNGGNSMAFDGGSVVSGDQSKFELVHEPSDVGSITGGSQVRFAS